MATRSYLFDLLGRRGLYVHYDGYVEGLGKTLQNHYNDPETVEHLFTYSGYYSSLAQTPEESDVIEHMVGTPADVIPDFPTFLDMREQFNYLWDGEQWHVMTAIPNLLR